MLRAKRITPAGWMRVSRELRRGVISVASKPTMRSWPDFASRWFSRCTFISNFFLEFRQKIQRLQRREAVQVHFAKLFQNWLGERREDG